MFEGWGELNWSDLDKVPYLAGRDFMGFKHG